MKVSTEHRNYDAAQTRRRLQPAVEELEAIGFLGPLAAADRYRKVGWGKWRVTFARNSFGQKPAGPTPETARPAEPPAGDVLARLQRLPGDEQAHFEREAVAGAAPFLRDHYRQY